MATDQLPEKAKEAFVNDNYQLAVDLYTQAINFNPKNADLFADRAQANIRLNYFTEAVDDANKAIELDPSMAKAYLHKGTACLGLEEYHTAKTALETGASLAQNDSRFIKLIKECDERIAEEGNDLRPLTSNISQTATHASIGSQALGKIVASEEGARPVLNESHQMEEKTSVKPKYRHAYYQTSEEVVVTIFAKGIPAENVVVEFGEQTMSVDIDILGENGFHFQPRLFGKIVPDKCRYEVLSTKLEIHLAKSEAINWTSLEYRMEVAVPQKINVPSAFGSQKLSYPSSKSRTTDWDKLEAQVKKEEKEEKLEGDASLNKFFGDIYKNADDDMRRAMIKSFVESNGTVLSTNWKDVGSQKVEGSPPDGMELKKWEY